MTIERPMFPPRAESVDSFPYQPGVIQRPAERPASGSLTPAEGLSRRTLLGTLAALALALPAAASRTELAIPDGFERVLDDQGRTWFKAVDLPDPAFTRIAAKLAADVAHGAAIDAQDEAEARFGMRSSEARHADETSAAMCWRAHEADWKLATTPPTTLAGVAAMLRFANQIEDEGGEWPGTDTIGSEGWHYQLRATMAQAIEAIFRKGDA